MTVIFAIMATLLMAALGGAIILTTSTEAMIAANFRNAQEAVYAADAALERAIDDLATVADWNAILDGSTRSPFVDGPASGIRTLADGSPLDLEQTLSMMNCRRVTPCSISSLAANTPQRPWGANNPVWRLFAFSPFSDLVPGGALGSQYYVIVMVGDDPSENDDNPLRDGDSSTNAGTNVLAVRAEAFGLHEARQAIEATVARPGADPTGIRVISWRLVK